MKLTKIRKENFIFTFLAVLMVILNIKKMAATYYVSNSGNDDANGTSPETAWQTIGHVNEQSFVPGDQILFRRGDTWRDTPLRIPSSGTNGNQIVFGAYGSGERPEILGSIEVTGWTNLLGNIWASDVTVLSDPWEIGYDGPEIFFEENDGSVSWGIHQSYDAVFSALTSEYHWTWNNNTIYVYSSSDPGSRYSAVEVPQQERGIMLLDNNYITVDGLAIKYYADQGIYDQYATIVLHGLRVTNCEIAYIGKKDGSAAYGMSVHQSDAYYAYNEIHNCGRRGISLTIYETTPITQSNIVIEHNHFHHGWHTTSLDCSTTGGHTIENIYFRNNLVEGDPTVQLDGVNPNSNHIFCDDQSDGSGTVQNLYFYNNIFTYAHGSSIKIGDAGNVFIYNNTFYNFNPTLANWQAHCFMSATPAPVEIKNNIFYNNAADNHWGDVEIENGYQEMFDIQNNLYYHTDPGTRIHWVDEGISYAADEWEAYTTNTGFDVESPPPADPLFIDAPNDFGLSEGSPAIGNAVIPGFFTTDYYGNSLNNPPDIGAIQYGSVAGLIDTEASVLRYIIYPNPANDFITVSVPDSPSEFYSVQIFNSQGARIFKNILQSGSDNITIETNLLIPGIYFICIYDGINSNTDKFIIQ
ncbi:MAG: T9SS type A sorting domain-containing protein [Bacteroidales bacterium]|nr:T9SS type A sorting domain-containing protein [Bacteroidales bacterium]